MTPEEAIRLIRAFEGAVASEVRRGHEAVTKRYQTAAKKLLAALLGRKPTEEEIQRLITW